MLQGSTPQIYKKTVEWIHDSDLPSRNLGDFQKLIGALIEEHGENAEISICCNELVDSAYIEIDAIILETDEEFKLRQSIEEAQERKEYARLHAKYGKE